MDNTKPTVAVLMSTYNGEKFLEEQLDSIFSQTGVNVKLYVRDDGSTDCTLHIIDQYAERFPIVKLADNENLGPGFSFMRLLYQYAFEPEIDFFAFADQDDIWLENKLWIGVEAINNSGFTGPVLYSSNQYEKDQLFQSAYTHSYPRTDLQLQQHQIFLDLYYRTKQFQDY